jgi:DNA mismatch repair protein MutS
MSDYTPLMAQYREIKAQYEDCVLLFRVGDFYETFYEDAIEVSRVLSIALTTRDKNKKNPVPLAGVPFHAAESYVTRLLAAGKKVAICEQTEDPSKAKGLVKRAVVEVLTPGTAMNAQFLPVKENNFCMAVALEGSRAGVAVIDVSTGEFVAGETDLADVQHMLQGKKIREVVYPPGTEMARLQPLLEIIGDPVVSERALREPRGDGTPSAIADQFGEMATDVREAIEPLEARAADLLLAHCHALRNGVLPQVVGLGKLGTVEYMALDEETIRNLELFEPLYGADTRATLVRLIDKTATPMGARELRAWMQKPLCHAGMIEERLAAVAEIYGDPVLHEATRGPLERVQDVQRIGARIAAEKAIPREFHVLADSLRRIPDLKAAMEDCESALLAGLRDRLRTHEELSSLIERAVVDDPPGHLRDGGVVREGFSPELDALIAESRGAKSWIAGLEKRERERTGISGLKVGFNKVFGYYIEVSKIHRASVPPDYLGKQTLVNAERFFTSDLKEREQLVLENEEKRVECEQRIYKELCAKVARELSALQDTAGAIARIDAIQSLAAAARQHRFRRPVVDESRALEIAGSRHPVLEQAVKEPFVPNDLFLDPDSKQFALITGPNMSGKSTFLRQVALTVVLGQMGSFVPADRARIGIVDKVFTRVGATDRLSRGESTFLVEMKETANILENMTDRSLVLLDEVGRGTSTYDGLSIAWAVTEYLLQGVKARPKTLFATHFHELTQLGAAYPRLVNLKITIKEWEGGVVFLRKVVPGTSDRSYGIHAARVAGLPPLVLRRAEDILKSLELRRDLLRQGVRLDDPPHGQLSLFRSGEQDPGAGKKSDILRELVAEFDVDVSTPLEALQLVKRLQDELRKS